MNYRECLLGLVLAGTLAPTAHAGGDDGETLRFQVAAHVQAQADPLQDGSIAVQLSPSGKRQTLAGAADADGTSRWSLEDVDSDGYPELIARAPVGMVNEAVAVYRFDPASAGFRALRAATHGRESCGELMGLMVDHLSRTLTSSCRSGPMWYTDQYRFAGATLYLYRAESVLMLGDTVNAALQWEQADEQGPLAVWRTYDPAGRVRESAIADGLGAPTDGPLRGQQATVVPARLFLFDRPGASSTKRYLVQGDRVELQDEQNGWVKLRYRSPNHGDVLGWINVND